MMLTEFLKDYLSIIIFLFVALGLSIGFIVLNFLFSPKNPDPVLAQLIKFSEDVVINPFSLTSFAIFLN